MGSERKDGKRWEGLGSGKAKVGNRVVMKTEWGTHIDRHIQKHRYTNTECDMK